MCNLNNKFKDWTISMLFGVSALSILGCEVSSTVTRTRHVSLGTNPKSGYLSNQNSGDRFVPLPSPVRSPKIDSNLYVDDTKIYYTKNPKLRVTGRFQKVAQKLDVSPSSKTLYFTDLYPKDEMKKYPLMNVKEAISQTLYLGGVDSNRLLRNGSNAINTYQGSIIIYDTCKHHNYRLVDFVPGAISINDSSRKLRVFYYRNKVDKLFGSSTATSFKK